MAFAELYKPLNLLAPQSYTFSVSGYTNYDTQVWEMTDKTRVGVIYGLNFEPAVFAVAKSGALEFMVVGSFTLTAQTTSDFERGHIYSFLPGALSGDDEVQGSGGADKFRGYTGDDSLRGGGGHDAIFGDEGDDILMGSTGDDTMSGGTGDDFLFVGQGHDIARGNAGNDFVAIEGAWSVTLDLASGARQGIGTQSTVILSGIEHALGSQGHDRLFGTNSRNFISAGEGRDTVDGRGGNDVLAGGGGSDVLYGGSGVDHFAFQTGAGRDIIKDYNRASDQIVFTDGPTRMSDIIIRDDGRNTLILYGDGDWIRIENLDHLTLTYADFTFNYTSHI